MMTLSYCMLLFYLLISICLKLSSAASSSSSSPLLCLRARWESNATIIPANWSEGHQRFSPWDIAFDSQQNIIIADWKTNRLLKYYKDGKIKTLASNVSKSSIFVDRSDNIYFTNDTVVKMLKTDGSLKIVAGNSLRGSDMNQLNWATGIYVDQKGSVYVADGGNCRVMKWESNATEGTLVAGGNGPGVQANQLFGPKCLFVDELNDNTLYICDVFNFRVQKFLKNSNIGITVLSKDINSLLDFPSSIFVDSNGVIYISQDKGILRWFQDLQRGEVVLVGHVGSTMDRLTLGFSFKFDKNWNILLTDAPNDRILKYRFKTSSCTTNK